MSGWRLEHTYAELPALFHARVAPTPVRKPQLVVFNGPLAEAMGLDTPTLATDEGAGIFAGNTLPEGAHPLAQAYAGHQFGHFTTLGDGRAILLGEQITPDGRRLDVQLKGAGQTPYSRRGDGRAALGPMLREFIISEAMHALGIPTTRSLAVVATGEPVFRETTLAGAVLTRVAASHIRVGTFEWAAARRDTAALAALADYTRRRHYPQLAEAARPHLALFDAIVERQAQLVARWQLVGFIHGVMNTDNMALSGETLDYGPCAFMDAYDPATVFSSIDTQGRYAQGNQPAIAQWNLARLAEAALPLFDERQEAAIELATAALDRFANLFHRHWLHGMRAKLGLFTEEAGDASLVDGLLTWMHEARADFTNTFRMLSVPPGAEATARADPTFAAWHLQWQARLGYQRQSAEDVARLMQRHNPAFIPRNHKVEEALAAATEVGDLSVMERLLEVLFAPYDHERQRPEYNTPPEPGRPYRTFCGT
jgi:uncharacterized protein YdiU (UPF0061 family)